MVIQVRYDDATVVVIVEDSIKDNRDVVQGNGKSRSEKDVNIEYLI